MKRSRTHLGIGVIGLASLLSMQSCQSPAVKERRPSSGNEELVDANKLEEIYARSVDLDYLRAMEKKIGVVGTSAPSGAQEGMLYNFAKIQEDQAKLKSLYSEIGPQVENLRADMPQSQWGEFKRDWRNQIEKLVISNPENYALKDGKIDRVLSLDLEGTIDYQLAIVNKNAEFTESKNSLIGGKEKAHSFEGTVKCDGDFKIKKTFTSSIAKDKQVDFKVSGKDSSVLLYLDKTINNCEVYFNDPKNPEAKYGVRLVSNLHSETPLAKLANRFESCILPDASGLKGVEKLFLTPHYKSMTCAEEINDIKTLELPIDGLKAKAATLLGQELSDDFLAKLNPYGELDFSKAPKLHTILISYLVFRHDFYGTLIARLAKWHADHGAQVRILMSDVIANKKDRLMLYGLVESSNNIKVQEFRYNSEEGGLDQINELHRTLHVKLLITLGDNPIDNVAYIGGRNIHDGFVFMKTPDHSSVPDLIQYGDAKNSDEGYAPWRDFEMRVRSKAFAEQIASHYMTAWQRDSQSFYVRSINQNFATKTPADPKYFDRAADSALVRHFVSLPYKDGEALEKLYVDLFDSAEKSVRLSTPYFRPTKKLGEAMARAVARGVDISLITRIDLSGDTADIILGDVNKEGINRFLNKIKIFEYTEPGVILHSKIVLIDGKLSIIGSVNLNKRSFVHDMENGIMIYSPAYNQKMNQIMDTYKNLTREVTEKQRVALWKRAVIGIFDKEF
ncbi:MAG: phospholipase D-like domain-containing protein [Bacteriovorax sp.]